MKSTETASVLNGALNGEVLTPFLAQLPAEQTCTLNFANVDSVNFSGIRALLNARNAGKRFIISNANAAVAELFEATGASKFISVCRAPQEIDLSEWVRSGEGNTAESFDHADGDAMMKLYFSHVSTDVIEQETRIAQAAFLMGVPTPMPGGLIRCGDRFGNTFERLANKRSFGRLLADEPERVEEVAIRLAKMAKLLHTTPCDKAVFPSYRVKLAEIIRDLPVFSDAEKDKLLGFLNDAEDTGMCIHGDLHIGNIITDGTVDLFIDMGDFCYGNPLFDLGAINYICHYSTTETCMRNYHTSKEVLVRLWEPFVKEYFGAETPAQREEVDNMLKPYTVYQMLIFLRNTACTHPLAEGVARELMQYM